MDPTFCTIQCIRPFSCYIYLDVFVSPSPDVLAHRYFETSGFDCTLSSETTSPSSNHVSSTNSIALSAVAEHDAALSPIDDHSSKVYTVARQHARSLRQQ